jgi:hypothetical protein
VSAVKSNKIVRDEVREVKRGQLNKVLAHCNDWGFYD